MRGEAVALAAGATENLLADKECFVYEPRRDEAYGYAELQ